MIIITMSENNLNNKKHDCFCCFLKKELEDNFSYNADAVNINNHFKHHMHEFSNPPIIQLKNSISKENQSDIQDVEDFFFGE